MFKRLMLLIPIAFCYSLNLFGIESEEEKKHLIEDEVAMEYDSEVSDCHDNVLRFNGMIYTEKEWIIWLNNFSIRSESNPQAVKIGNHMIQVLSVDREKKTVRLMVDTKEIQLALRQEYSL